MADTLIIDPNGANIRVFAQRAGLSPDRRVGDIDQASAGNRRSFITAEYRVAALVFVNTPPSVCKQIKDIFRLGAQVETAGSVWLNDDPDEIVVCDGVYSDDMEQGGPWRVPGITLNEVGSATPSVPLTTDFILTGVPTGGTNEFVASPTPTYPGDVELYIDTFDGVTLTGALQVSAVPEFSFKSVPLAAGFITGRPDIQMLATSPLASFANPNSTQARVYLVRGGSNVAGPFETNYAAAYLGGDLLHFITLDPLILEILDGDQLLIEMWSQIRLLGTDDGSRQRLFFGTNPGPTPAGSIMRVSGLIEAL